MAMITVDKVSFCALPIYKVKVEKFDKKSSDFVSQDAMFVLLDGKSKLDKKAVKEAVKTWGEAPFKNAIETSFQWMNIKTPDNIKIYALTEQLSNLKKLNYNQILGLADVRTEKSPDEITLTFLQVRPDAQNINNTSPRYAGSGTSMVKSLQKIYDKIESEVVPNEMVEKFYTNLGFIKDEVKGEYYYTWQKCWIIRAAKNIRKLAALF